ncbi:MAG TPA: trypsin-like serine protease [Clostridiaceae bacterium]|nr:trypsin-like serine protease [Clostridiaceae bacterium]
MIFDENNNYRLNKDDINNLNNSAKEYTNIYNSSYSSNWSSNSYRSEDSASNDSRTNFYKSLNAGSAYNSGSNNYKGSTVYYSESYSKKNKKSKKGFNLFQLILVAVLSSILGGGVVFAAFQFLAPVIQPEFSSTFNKVTGQNVSATGGTNTATTYKIEIEKSDSPIVWIAKKVSPSIVGIKVSARVQSFFFGEQNAEGEGSGIIIREDGYILTNYHVIQNAYDANTNKVAKNATIEVYLWDQKDKPYKAEIVGVDWKTDLAVIKIEGKGFPAAELGDSDKLEVGELAVAIGNPGGLEYMGSVTAGIISGLDRTVQTESGYEFKLIQTDAAINPGNSGGALVNSEGKVIGVNSIKIVATGFEGIGFAIPINTAREIFEDLIEHRYVTGRPLIGIQANPNFNSRIARANGVPDGVLVASVVPFSGAYNAGIKEGDIITKCQGQPVTTLDELNKIKDQYKPGDVLEMEIYRHSERKTFTVQVVLSEDKPTFDEE